MDRNTRNVMIFVTAFFVLLVAINVAADRFDIGYPHLALLYIGYILVLIVVFVIAVKTKSMH